MPFDKIDNSALTPDEIRAIQGRLEAHGFPPGPIDGIWGPMTSAAVVAFKRSIGFISRPWVGPKTWAALNAEPEPVDDDLPPWVQEGLRVRGCHERADNARLSDWLASDGHALGDPAVFPWCGDFVETAIRLTLPSEPFPGPVGENPYWALNWRHFGAPCEPCLGAVISITRSGGGHVGFAVGQDTNRYFVLGGNQSNRVSVAPIAKSRFRRESWRWPVTYDGPQRPLRWMTGGASVQDFA